MLKITLMRTVSGTRSATRARLAKVVALFLLAYSFANIICPQYCCEEMIGLYQAGSVVVVTVGETSACFVADSRCPWQEQNSGAVPGDEDCFCLSPMLTSQSQSAHLAGAPPAIQVLYHESILTRLPLLSEAHLTFHVPPEPPVPPLILNKSIRC